MAAILGRLSRSATISGRHARCLRTLKTQAFRGSRITSSTTYLCGVAAATSAYLGWRWLHGGAVVQAAKPRRHIDESSLRGLKLNHRERRFIKFSSVEYQGQLYMSPQDFIESVTDSEPRQPQTGFRIAFNMFDTDGNERVDKEEFLVLMDLITAGVFRAYASWVSDTIHNENPDSEKAKKLQSTRQVVSQLLVGRSVDSVRVGLEKIFSTARRDRLNRALEGAVKANDADADDEVVLEDELQKSHVVDTTLLLHFFGRKGKQDLKFEEFKMFMENLQTEVLEIEFNEFSKGLPAITELDFAKILLRYTYLQSDQYEMYLERLLDRIPEGKGITFSEFKSFCQFLNTLDDFAIAMKMYTLADQPISQEEFHRAVKICTGAELSPHIVDTVFKIFDDDGDGQLSYKEFIAIMRDRLHRGFKQQEPSEGWAGFKACVKNAMRSQQQQDQQPSLT
ncbi:calcium uptake protein 3, mitochondrial-like isoform X5 [Portunus trituberculatus]|uniref:calcium uptake protein 3, mitochondrial-like isoform X5 n=1 Tax=Portunus trituberculatus TaxID=210409 RepID=UPI001E1CCD2A|nr:calcium uptake protein 3, mitochondrial-like isoform X5 [Portunus trituberculatus]